MTTVDSREAERLLRSGQALAGLTVTGAVNLHNAADLTHLPPQLTIDVLHIYNAPLLTTLPDGLTVQVLSLKACPALTRLSDDLQVENLSLAEVPITTLPALGITLQELTVADCPHLEHFPSGFHLDVLNVNNCPRITALPEDLQVERLNLWNLPHLTHLPATLQGKSPPSADAYPTTTGVVLQSLTLRQCPRITTLPPLHLTDFLHLEGCPQLTLAPATLSVATQLTMVQCPRITALPDGLHLSQLRLDELPDLSALPDDLSATDYAIINRCPRLVSMPPGVYRAARFLSLADCPALTSLPAVLHTKTLDLTNCTHLTALPAALHVQTLTITGCSALATWPAAGIADLEHLHMRGCRGLTTLPPRMRRFGQLDIADCTTLAPLPLGLAIVEWLDVGGLPEQILPPAPAGWQLRWYGIALDGIAIWHTAVLSIEHILSEPNVERRRVLIERLGMDRFLDRAQPTLLDADTDPGGSRQLLRIDLTGDEPLVMLAVRDPSTGRRYTLRVPPAMQSCRQAAAWIAGFDDPNDYAPLQET